MFGFAMPDTDEAGENLKFVRLKGVLQRELWDSRVRRCDMDMQERICVKANKTCRAIGADRWGFESRARCKCQE